MSQNKNRNHLGEYNKVTVVMWAVLISLLVFPVVFGTIAGLVALFI